MSSHKPAARPGPDDADRLDAGAVRRIRHLWPVLLLLIVGTPVPAQVTGGPPWLRPPPLVPDSVVRPLVLGLTRLPLFVPMDVQLAPIDSLMLFMTVPFREYLRRWSVPEPEWRLSGLPRDREGDTAAAADPAPSDLSTLFLPPPAAPADTAADELLPGALGRYADLNMTVGGYGELGGSWQRFQPCDPSLHVDCNPGLFPQLRPDVQFNVQVNGTITERIHVNVDYDQVREETFNSNQIQVFYQGLPNEVLQHVEVGDVQFRLPRSRYLTESVPAGNFGVTASGQLGPVDFQTVWAQQRGDLTTREFRLAGGANEGLVQDDRIVLDDADYIKGQFFFLADPSNFTGYPHIDAPLLRATEAPATIRPVQGGVIEVFRDERIPPQSNQQQSNLFLADALTADGTVLHSGQFRRLEPDQDYIVHQSGLWIMLRSALRRDEALAIAYLTESGDTVGTLNAEQSPPGTVPVLRLLRSPAATHQPGSPTWDLEMHQVYRVVGSSGLDPGSLQLTISLGDIVGGQTFREAPSGQVTYLRLFGLDEDAPAERVDGAQVFQPDALTAGATTGARISGTYIIFPTLEPFLDPPPVPSANLSAAEAKALLGNDANGTIYENTDPVIRENAGRFRLNIEYRVNVEGLVDSFNLGVFGIREGSERITVGDQLLARDVDYFIDYELGQVTLASPQTLFGANPDAEIRAQWEQRSLFDIAPTSMFGANATYRLGSRGTLNFVGLYQSQRTLYARPELGTEPASSFMGGVTADLDLGGQWLDRALSSVPGLRTQGGASVRLTGEVALSQQDPNQRGEAWFEDFEATNETAIDPRRQQWKLGSRPDDPTGDQGLLPVPTDATTAARLVWQHDFATATGEVGGSLVPQRDIDRQINIIGNQLPEPAMWLTFGDSTVLPGQRVWRSITTVLSTSGRDMTRDEFIEFYVRAGVNEPTALILDLGTVSEDAMYIDAAGATSGTYPDGRPWGLGILDEEARLAEREVWGAAADARGLWNQNCQATPLQAYPLGDSRSNCTRGNGVADTEDLDNNGVLDQNDGPSFRYVVRLDELSPYLVRDTAQTGTAFRLYRIPLRDGVPVNGAVQGTFRFIRHLRMTLAGEPGSAARGEVQLAIARMRIIGSSWTKRDVFGIIAGLIGDEPSPNAALTELTVGPVSRLTDGVAYSPPPGITDQAQDPSAEFGGRGIEVNEKGQRIRYDGLAPDDRAEIYFRYPQQARSFMEYRRLRVWALAKRGTWGASGGERLLLKVGTDARNYYLYRTALPAAIGDRDANPGDWSPEILIDFERWFELRARAAERQARGIAAAIDTVWSADSTYAVVLEDQARAPNLAAVREFSIAVHNGDGIPIDGEVWINDIRLDLAVRDPGGAANVTFDVASDVVSGSVSYATQGGVFRQLNTDASYVSTGDLSMNGRLQLDRMLPAAWGLSMPVSVTHTRSARDPTFLERSDVRADGLDGLRDAGAGRTSVGVRVSKQTPSASPVLRLLVDPTILTFGYDRAHTNTITSRNEAAGLRAGIDWTRLLAQRDIDIMPGFLESALRALAPAAIENSAFFERLVSGRMRWTPQRLEFGTDYIDSNAKAFRYTSILVDPADTILAPIESPRELLENRALIAFAPFSDLTADLSIRSGRDLLEPERATQQPLAQQALRDARGSLAGADIGWETNRTMTASLAFRPVLATWLRPTYAWTNQYRTARDPSYFEIETAGTDSMALLQRRFGSDRQISRRLDFQPTALIRALGPDSADGFGGALRSLIGAVQTINITWNTALGSQFDRETAEPGFGYRLGFGSLGSFRTIDGDTAIAATERSDVRMGTTAGLPLGLQLNVTYTDGQTNGFDIRGGQRRQQATTWPSVRLAWPNVPVPSAVRGVVLAASVQAGYELAERTNIYGTGNPQIRGSREKRYPAAVSLTFPAGIRATWNGTFIRGTSADPTGDGEQRGANHAVQLGGNFDPPGLLGEKFTRPINALLAFTEDTQRRCRFRTTAGTTADCVAFLDTSNRNVNFTLDTVVSDITVGMQFSYTSRLNRVGATTGSSQFQAKLFGRFRFEGGG
ncbi:MAG TPA: cell surface protein SprA [Longimicrobiales bacterium]|nr:cell surface protein SprA [Longimicrobiales bacterium]